jgi:hypothetical protein
MTERRGAHLQAAHGARMQRACSKHMSRSGIYKQVLAVTCSAGDEELQTIDVVSRKRGVARAQFCQIQQRL